MAGQPLSRRHRSLLRWLAAAHERPGRVTSSSHQVLGRVLPSDTGHISARLRTLEADGLIVIERSPSDKAQYRRLTAEGPKMGLEMRIKL
jgi:DNA-binding MarR family transcriptional regulator